MSSSKISESISLYRSASIDSTDSSIYMTKKESNEFIAKNINENSKVDISRIDFLESNDLDGFTIDLSDLNEKDHKIAGGEDEDEDGMEIEEYGGFGDVLAVPDAIEEFSEQYESDISTFKDSDSDASYNFSDNNSLIGGLSEGLKSDDDGSITAGEDILSTLNNLILNEAAQLNKSTETSNTEAKSFSAAINQTTISFETKNESKKDEDSATKSKRKIKIKKNEYYLENVAEISQQDPVSTTDDWPEIVEVTRMTSETKHTSAITEETVKIENENIDEVDSLARYRSNNEDFDLDFSNIIPEAEEKKNVKFVDVIKQENDTQGSIKVESDKKENDHGLWDYWGSTGINTTWKNIDIGYKKEKKETVTNIEPERSVLMQDIVHDIQINTSRIRMHRFRASKTPVL